MLVAADSRAVPTLVVAPVVAVVGSAAIAVAVVPLVTPAVAGKTTRSLPVVDVHVRLNAQDRRTLRMPRATGNLRVAYVTQ